MKSLRLSIGFLVLAVSIPLQCYVNVQLQSTIMFSNVYCRHSLDASFVLIAIHLPRHLQPQRDPPSLSGDCSESLYWLINQGSPWPWIFPTSRPSLPFLLTPFLELNVDCVRAYADFPSLLLSSGLALGCAIPYLLTFASRPSSSIRP
ncbi:hypothetical protein OE88DRAFT_1229911 [Heliocybe sulcata]|uniref:Uncharacterized protein n=1 Tax=Heliocybe sulcata TaxID=5364 RepID=A0A5C3MIQ1_9AGAM|nr:hypothetical protein OE88DRAFT_1229911 [Heliocybe sulcata]